MKFSLQRRRLCFLTFTSGEKIMTSDIEKLAVKAQHTRRNMVKMGAIVGIGVFSRGRAGQRKSVDLR
jgi:hypothetical protein